MRLAVTVSIVLVMHATPVSPVRPSGSGKSPGAVLRLELAIDLTLTAAIVAGLVFFLNESLTNALTGPVFMVLVSASLIHPVYEYFSRRAASHG